jgi:amidohydrolase
MEPTLRSFEGESRALYDQLVAWRRDFHQHPEIAFEEVRTAGIVAKVLTQLGLEVQGGVGKTGVVGVLEGAYAGPTLLVRADMDALPVQEENQTIYVSRIPGKMHACGHDAHTAIVLGVATILAQNRDHLAGCIKFVFQPAEELGQGAEAMIEDGVLENPTPEIALGLHVWSSMPVRTIAVADGPTMAGAQSFILRVEGKGGHAGEPSQACDPVVAAAQIIVAAQTIVSRNIRALDQGVVSFTQFQAGDAYNVIPASVEMRGTIRSFKPEIHEVLTTRLRELAEGIALAMGCKAWLQLNRLLPPLVNHASVGKRLRGGFHETYPDLEILEDARTMGGEDMSYFLQTIPGMYFFVGCGNAERGLNFPHHHPRFDIDEEALVIGTSLLTAAVADYVWSK